MTYQPGIPAGNDNLSQSQGDIQDNFNQLNVQFAIDHTAFNTGSGNGDGLHKQIHFPLFTAPSVISGSGTQGGVVYSAAGVASATTANLNFKNNANLVFPLSLIKAYALVDTNGTVVTSQSLNVVSVVRGGTGTSYVVTLTAGAVNGTTAYTVISQAVDFNILIHSTPTDATHFNARSIKADDGTNQYPIGNWSFIVLQL